MSEGRHTILLIQTTKSRSSRTYLDYESVSEAMDGICGLFEKKLKESQPTQRLLSYDVEQLYGFLDEMVDISALVYEGGMYQPHPKSWIKKRCYMHLRRQASK
ncbi:hypothetical protein BSKO_02083 [Bryopsis sp. KO-2023]|nr:hypothetical protein BSKO_02083 [Bryopsis sp. KO-2023]